VAAIPGSDGAIQGCYKQNSGDLRVVESAGDCRKSETAIQWNQKGPVGPQGPAGEQGPPGPLPDVGDTKLVYWVSLEPGDQFFNNPSTQADGSPDLNTLVSSNPGPSSATLNVVFKRPSGAEIGQQVPKFDRVEVPTNP
jgi:hypothetical protein